MQLHNYNTEDTWKILLLLINMMVMGIVLAIAYITIGDEVSRFLDRPQYSQEQLSKMTREREKLLRRARNEDWDLIENGIHLKTGLKADDNLKVVISACTSCHSAKLITQNRATRDGWKNLIVWMQETQGLPDLGSSEPIILNYLADHYAPEASGRRANLDTEAIEWYVLNLEE